MLKRTFVQSSVHAAYVRPQAGAVSRIRRWIFVRRKSG